MKNIIVASHERSGTHFLINTISMNFNGISNLELSIESGEKDVIRAGLLNHGPTNRIFKSHHEAPYMPIDELLDKYHVFYIVRDGRDTLVSCYHHYVNYLPMPEFGVYLRQCKLPVHIGSFYTYGLPPINMADKWSRHVMGWLQADGVHVFKYEDLLNNIEQVLDIISSIIRSPRKRFVQPTLNNRVADPRKGIIGDWHSEFDKEDLAFFDANAEGAMKRIGYYE